MIESSSRYFRVLPNEGQSDTVVELVFPVPVEEPGKLVGKKAEDIAKLSGRIGVIKACDRVETSPDSSKPTEYNPRGKRLEFRRQPVPNNVNEIFTLTGWEMQDDGEAIVNEIEAQLGVSGLTIVLERGIIERAVDSRQAKP